MDIKTIVARDNTQIKKVALLATDAKERAKHRAFVAHGMRTCSTLIEGGMRLEQLYVLEDSLANAQKFTPDERITIVSEFVMDKINPATNPSGVVGVFAMPAIPAATQLTPGLVLANITDPGNMGTLIRSAVAMGVRSIVCLEGVDVFNPKVVQASAGTLAHAQLFQWTWQELMKHKKELLLYALMPRNGKAPQTVDAARALIVVGNEANGIRQEWLRDCDGQVTLPMPGNAESLNAAIAGSIATYIIFGQR